jgi:HSP20 family protein
MSQVPIQKCKDIETIPQKLLRNMESIADSIRQRAFNLFQSRAGASGSEVDDWLQAERDVVWSPASELVEDEKEFRARIAVPGFDAKQIEVSALPDALIIRADASHTHEGKNGNVHFCEFSGKELFRQLPLSAAVDVDKVTASLDRGILQVTAPKAASKQMTVAA